MKKRADLVSGIVAWGLVGLLVSFGAITSASIGLGFFALGALVGVYLVLRKTATLVASLGGFVIGAGIGLASISALTNRGHPELIVGAAVLILVGGILLSVVMRATSSLTYDE